MPRKIWATVVALVFALMSGLVLALPASANSPVNMYCNPEPVGSAGVEFDPTLVDPTQTTGWSAGVQYQGFNEAVTPFTPAGGYYEALWIDPSAPTYNTSSVTGTLYLNGQAVASNTLQHSSCGWSPPLPTQINLPPTPTLVDDASLQNDSHYVAPASQDPFTYTQEDRTVKVCISQTVNQVFAVNNSKCYTWPIPPDVYINEPPKAYTPAAVAVSAVADAPDAVTFPSSDEFGTYSAGAWVIGSGGTTAIKTITYTLTGTGATLVSGNGWTVAADGKTATYTVTDSSYAPAPATWTTGTWNQKNGVDNAPCSATTHWVLTGKPITAAEVSFDGGATWVAMTQNGNGSWAYDYSGVITVTSVVKYRYQGEPKNPIFTLSSCTGAPAPTSTSTPTPSVTPSVTPSTTPSGGSTTPAGMTTSTTSPAAARGVGGNTGVDEQAPAGSLGSVALFGLVLMSLIGLGAWRMRPKGAHC